MVPNLVLTVALFCKLKKKKIIDFNYQNNSFLNSPILYKFLWKLIPFSTETTNFRFLTPFISSIWHLLVPIMDNFSKGRQHTHIGWLLCKNPTSLLSSVYLWFKILYYFVLFVPFWYTFSKVLTIFNVQNSRTYIN